MINPALDQFINSRRQSGINDKEIRKEVLAKKWSEEALNDAFELHTSVSSKITHYYRFGELFSKSFSVFTKKLRSAFFVLFLPTVFTTVVMLLIGLVAGVGMGIISALSLQGSPVIVPLIVISCVIALFVFVSMVIFQLWGGVAVMFTIFSEKKVKLIEAYKQTWKFVRSYWWISVLEVLILFSGFLFLIVPGIILGIWFIFSQFVLIDEEARGMDALMISREYVRGYSWSIFWRLVLLVALVFCIEAPFMIIISLFKLDNNILVDLFGSILNMILSVFGMTYLVTMYKNIKSVKGGKVEILGKSKWGFIIWAVLGVFCFLGIPVVVLLAAIDPAKQIKMAKTVVSTANRAEIENGVVAYYTETGNYPISLDILVPTYLNKLPINPDESFCYSVAIEEKLGVISVSEVQRTGSECDLKIVVK